MKPATIDEIYQLLIDKQPVHYKFSESDRLVIERSLPYLCMYRYQGEPDQQFAEIVKTQAAYLIIDGNKEVKDLLASIATAISETMNTFMLLEVWPGPLGSKTFEVYCPEGKAPGTVSSLKDSLSAFGEGSAGTEIDITGDRPGHPPAFDPPFTFKEAVKIGCLPVSLQIPPVYLDPQTGEPYAIYFRGIKSYLSETFKKAAFEFIRVQTSSHFHHYLMFGKTRIDEAARAVDSYLAELSGRMDFLLRVTPVNAEEEWEAFKAVNFQEMPRFNYRMISLDPELEKRNLYNLPIDRVEDPTLAFILRDKRLELEKQLNMLEERESPDFMYLSQSVYGVPDEKLLKNARYILDNIEPDKPSRNGQLDCQAFASKARKEMEYYQERFSGQELTVEVRHDVSGLMVTKSRLLVSDNVSIGARRAEALIQHEVGTHVLTYCNGRQQTLQQLAAGFAGYEELQEGLAVLAEYLVGGLTGQRLRLLAARVLAADHLIAGADFVETFNELREGCGLGAATAYNVAMRVFRGGGLTKDAIYLRGLTELLDYLREGGDIELLFTGKFNLKHVPLIEELVHRNILKKAVLPRFLGQQEAQQRLTRLQTEVNFENLLA